MSDFDKEAEREKLREKFERDKQKRQQSERMSELLLKGATMTNKHHDCGSPIFRWNGEEFCPSCEGENGAGGRTVETQQSPDETAPESEPTSAAAGSTADAIDEAADAAADGVDEAAEDASAAVDDAAPAAGETDTTEIDVTAESAMDRGADDRDGTDRTPAPRSTHPAPSGRVEGADREADGEPTTGDGVAAAAASIERTLADVARQAEETPTTDLTHKRNLVAATKETAEALEAIRRASRQ